MKRWVALLIIFSIALLGCFSEEKNGKVVGSVTSITGSEISVYSSGSNYITVNLPLAYTDKGSKIVLSEDQTRTVIARLNQFDKVIDEVKAGNTSIVYATINLPVAVYSPRQTFLYFDASCGGSVDNTKFSIRFVDPLAGAGTSGLKSIYLTQTETKKLAAILSDAIRSNQDVRSKVARLVDIITSTSSGM